MQNIYYIYIILCEKNKLYTGITTDYSRRFKEHSGIIKNKGAKFTKVYNPIEIVLLYRTNNRSNALKLEYRIKQLKRYEKDALIKSNKCFKMYFGPFLDADLYKRLNIRRRIL